MAELGVIWQGEGFGASLGIALGKNRESPGRSSTDPAGRDLWRLSRREANAAGNSVPNVLPGCCLLHPHQPFQSQTNCPRPPQAHTHSQCSPHPASGQRLPGSFPPITLPSLWKLIDGSNGDGQMLKLVWRLNSCCHCNIPRLSAPFIIYLDILENIPSNLSGNNIRE